jgi:hypothetical protein
LVVVLGVMQREGTALQLDWSIEFEGIAVRGVLCVGVRVASCVDRRLEVERLWACLDNLLNIRYLRRSIPRSQEDYFPGTFLQPGTAPPPATSDPSAPCTPPRPPPPSPQLPGRRTLNPQRLLFRLTPSASATRAQIAMNKITASAGCTVISSLIGRSDECDQTNAYWTQHLGKQERNIHQMKQDHQLLYFRAK